MAINFNDNLRILAAKPIDSRYYNNQGTPWASTNAVYSGIPVTYRYIGLTVNVSNVEWWFANDTNTLVEKTGGSGGGSANTNTVVLAETITLAGTEYGSYDDGDTIISGTTVQTILETMFQKQVPPTYTSPTFNLDPSSATVEVGTVINYSLLPIFEKQDAGDVNRYTLVKDYNGFQYSLVDTTIVSAYNDITTDTVKDGADLSYEATVYYDEGDIKDDNLGNPYPSGRIPSGDLSDTYAVFGARRYYYGGDTQTTAPINNTEVKALSGNALNASNGTTFTINIAAGSTRVCFAYPATLQDVSTVKYVELGNGEVKDTFTQTTVSVGALNDIDPINYKVYTYLPAVPFGGSATYNVTI